MDGCRRYGAHACLLTGGGSEDGVRRGGVAYRAGPEEARGKEAVRAQRCCADRKTWAGPVPAGLMIRAAYEEERRLRGQRECQRCPLPRFRAAVRREHVGGFGLSSRRGRTRSGPKKKSAGQNDGRGVLQRSRLARQRCMLATARLPGICDCASSLVLFGGAYGCMCYCRYSRYPARGARDCTASYRQQLLELSLYSCV